MHARPPASGPATYSAPPTAQPIAQRSAYKAHTNVNAKYAPNFNTAGVEVHRSLRVNEVFEPLVTPTADSDLKLKIYALGGLEEIGRNCTVIECGDDIIIIDVGLMFPEEGMPGIDYIIPNVAGFKGREKNIRGVIITHGHLDHIGAISHVLPKIGNPPI
jgi:ribonuclease J